MLSYNQRKAQEICREKWTDLPFVNLKKALAPKEEYRIYTEFLTLIALYIEFPAIIPQIKRHFNASDETLKDLLEELLAQIDSKTAAAELDISKRGFPPARKPEAPRRILPGGLLANAIFHGVPVYVYVPNDVDSLTLYARGSEITSQLWIDFVRPISLISPFRQTFVIRENTVANDLVIPRFKYGWQSGVTFIESIEQLKSFNATKRSQLFEGLIVDLRTRDGDKTRAAILDFVQKMLETSKFSMISILSPFNSYRADVALLAERMVVKDPNAKVMRRTRLPGVPVISFNLSSPIPMKSLTSLYGHMVLKIEDFITKDDARNLVQFLKQHHQLFNSSPVDDPNDTHNDDRTSRSAYLTPANMISAMPDTHSIIKRIKARASIVTGRLDLEDLQVVRYTVGQQFKMHHDDSEFDPDDDLVLSVRKTNVRYFTLLLYLNDVPVASGGATVFPKLNLFVQPTAGTAVLWCNYDTSVLIESEGETVIQPDWYMLHSGEAIKDFNTVKYAINIWTQDLK